MAKIVRSTSHFLLVCSSLNFFACNSNPETQNRVDSLPFYNSAEFTPEWIPENSKDYQSIHQIAPFAFYNQNGELVNNQTVTGKIYVTDFFFTTCPSLCPKLTGNMSRLQEEFRNDDEILLVSHTVMPWVDSVDVLRNYGERMEIDPNKWLLLTGEAESIYQMARKSYFAELEVGYSRSPDEFIHTENFILVDQLGRIRGIYNGTLGLEIRRIIEDIKLLKNRG